MWFYNADLKHFRKGRRDKDGQEGKEEQESYISDMGSLFNRIKANTSTTVTFYFSIPGDSEHKASTCNAGNLGLIHGLGRCPGERNGNPLQYSCLENPIDRGVW